MKGTPLVCSKLFILFLFTGLRSFAGHERAGYISYTQTSGNTYHFKIITYTDPLDYLSDRCSEIIAFTNISIGTTDTLTCHRTNTTPGIELESLNPQLAGCNSGNKLGEGLMLVYPDTLSCPAGDYYHGVKFNIYEGDYTFSDTGRYVLGIIDPTLDNYVNNVGGGNNSKNVNFALADTLNITNNLAYNNSPTASNSLIDSVCIGQNFSYNLNLVDIDNDSLSYFIIPFITGDLWTNFYSASACFIPSGMVINAVTGNLSWQTTVGNCNYGEYDVDILVKEYRRVGGIMMEIGNEIFSIQINALCSTAAGIDKLIVGSNQIIVYPNPAKGILNVKCNIENAELNFIDVLGNIVMRQITSKELTSIDIGGLNEGVYFVQVKTKEKNYTQKIVVQH